MAKPARLVPDLPSLGSMISDDLRNGHTSAKHKGQTDTGHTFAFRLTRDTPSFNTGHTFAFTLAVKGTGSLGFGLLGADSQAKMQSSWPHPGFGGAFLPNTYDLSADGFTAEWSLHKFARALPSTWLAEEREVDLHAELARTTLFQPVTAYTVVDRGIKYGILFIGLTFLTFVCFELMTTLRFHYIQYAVVGGALVLFYQTLLALSEHLPFVWAYVVATGVLSGLITWYVSRMTKRLSLTVWVGSVLLTLYACMYVLLQLEAHALLIGTLLLVVALIALMYVTRDLTETRVLEDDSGSVEIVG